MTPTDNAKTEADRPAESVASPAENAKLEHTDGGVTTRDDLHDAGVPMAPADEPEKERVGPEDALGAEPTRGDYSDRIDSGPHMRAVPLSADERKAADERTKEQKDAGVPAEVPRSKLVEQTPSS